MLIGVHKATRLGRDDVVLLGGERRHTSGQCTVEVAKCYAVGMTRGVELVVVAGRFVYTFVVLQTRPNQDLTFIPSP